MADPNFFGFDAIDGKVQLASSTVSNTFTDSGDLVTAAAHGLANGDVVVFQTKVTTTGLTTFVEYFVVSATTNTFQIAATYGGSAVVLTSDGTGTYKSIVEVDLKFINKATPSADSQEFTYSGDGLTRKQKKTTGYQVVLSADCLTQDARETIFSMTAVTSGLPAAYTRGVWEGTTTELAGVACGVWLEGTATKVDATTGVESSVYLRRWWPVGRIVYDGPPEQESSNKFGLDQYTFTASKTSVDICGGALPSVPSGGAFQIPMEKAA